MRNFKVKNEDNGLLIRRAEDLVRQFSSCLETMLATYSFLFSKEEEISLIESLKSVKFYLNNKFLNEEEQLDYLKNLMTLEDLLKPFVLRCWQSDFEKGSQAISWLKDDQYRKKDTVISASLTTENSFNIFCDGLIGLSYKLDSNSYLGALPRDAAVVVNTGEGSIYSLMSNEDYVIDSYGMATPIITPYEIARDMQEGKYCEIVLDARYAVPTSIVYFRDDDYDMAESLAQQLNLPIQNLNVKEKK